jgi:hypothetical protein
VVVTNMEDLPVKPGPVPVLEFRNQAGATRAGAMKTYKVYVTPDSQPFTIEADDAEVNDGYLFLVCLEPREPVAYISFDRKGRSTEHRAPQRKRGVAVFATWTAVIQVDAS